MKKQNALVQSALRKAASVCSPRMMLLGTAALCELGASTIGAAQPAVVQGVGVNLRSRPSAEGAVLATLDSGTVLNVLGAATNPTKPGEAGSWSQVQWPDSVPVWIHSDYVLVDTVTVSRLNLRREPTEKAGILGQLRRGDKVAVIAQKGNWLQIEAPSWGSLEGNNHWEHGGH